MTAATTVSSDLRRDEVVTTIPFRRLVAVELRKSVDTRAARATLAIPVGLSGLGLLLVLVLSAEPSLELAVLPAALVGVVMPIIGVMTMTSEWSQRTALVTFWLVPRRSRVLAAKVVATTLLAVATIAATFVTFVLVGVLALSLRGLPVDFGAFDDEMLAMLLATGSGIYLGLAWGALLRWTAAAVVAVIVIPAVVDPLLWVALGDRAQWLTCGTVQAALGGTETAPGAVLTSLLLWYVVPFGLGWFLQVRREAA
ncbi:hypothetical protein [Cellulomonas xiejunii]|uniref:ABC transporter permease n=1 Tax=Cellulomonas xiejunii TaxID=2968083 RepID=A0ABY5KRS1_9CELL|nr:hypothetical protein [Cellulomonas xiejunii]MCC2321881.1 hypothetical protein [Cellulomonas xiejunii]UUI73182.1 hypothetical protein NP048_07040 [Cellulomonas xiejunii]